MDFEKTIKTIDEFGHQIVENYKEELEKNNYQDGTLYKTISYDVKTNNGEWTISIHLEEYWKYIENGRRAGAKFPPLDVIEKWIVRKQIIPRPMTLKSGRTVIPSIHQLSFLIARSISQKGIPGKPFFKNSFEAAKQEYLDKITQALYEDVKRGLSD